LFTDMYSSGEDDSTGRSGSASERRLQKLVKKRGRARGEKERKDFTTEIAEEAESRA
jgi:hypothetical protein